MTFRLLLVLFVFGLDFWAIYRLMGEPIRRRERWKWIALVVVLPVAGIILWRREARRKASLDARLAAAARQ